MHRIDETNFATITGFLQHEGLTGERDWLPAGVDGPTVLARADDRTVGVARVYRYWLHPKRWRLAIHVTPDARRQGIGTDLLSAIIAQLPAQDRDLQASALATNTEAIQFLAHASFLPLMTTRIGSLDPTSVPEQRQEMSHRDRRALEHQGIRIETLRSNQELFLDVALLHERIYRDQHGWNPPSNLTPEQCVELFMNDDELDPSLQFLALEGQNLRGIASLRTTVDPDVLDFGWLGAVDVPEEPEKLIYRALWGVCIESARRQRASISLEIDQVDPHVNATVDELPIRWDDTWITYTIEMKNGSIRDQAIDAAACEPQGKGQSHR